MSKQQISVSIFLDVIQGLCKLGMNYESVLNTIGLQPEQLSDPDAQISAHHFYQLWDYAHQELAHIPALALTLGGMSNIGDYGIVGHVALTSPNIRGAYLHFQRYSHLLCNLGEVHHAEEQNLFKFYLNFNGKEQYRAYFAEKIIAGMTQLAKLYLGATSKPQYVSFKHAKPANVTPYEQLFNCPVHFSAPQDSLVVLKEEVDRHCKPADQYLANLLSQHAEKLLSKLSENNSLKNKVQQLLIELLPKGEANIERIASELCMSRWTLNRRLKEENTSYQALLESMRSQMAKNYLQQKMSVTEVAFLLGFSEPSAFHRAFKRWSGEAPGVYRQNAGTPI